MSAIYKITCLANNKIYIGRSQNPSKRWYEHCVCLKSNKHLNRNLQDTWNEYGQENFTFSIVEEVYDNELLIEREDFWIEKTQSYDPEIGFNIINPKKSKLNRPKKIKPYKVEESSFEKFVNMSILADFLSVKPITIRGWMKQNLIPYYKIGKLYRFRISEVIDRITRNSIIKPKYSTGIDCFAYWQNREKVLVSVSNNQVN